MFLEPGVGVVRKYEVVVVLGLAKLVAVEGWACA